MAGVVVFVVGVVVFVFIGVVVVVGDVVVVVGIIPKALRVFILEDSLVPHPGMALCRTKGGIFDCFCWSSVVS